MVNYRAISTMQNVDQIKNALLNYNYQNCDSPQKVRVFSAIEGRFVFREMPCGRCWHCCSSKSNEMVTRLFNHCETWKYRYFVTLTYAPAFSMRDCLTDYVLYNFLVPTMPLWNCDNSTGSFGFQPTLLCRSHLQNYFKRLRHLLYA